MFRTIAQCRVCGNPNLAPILHLGQQCLTGVFPASPRQPLAASPLELVKCHGPDGPDHCGLVQLRHTYDASEMYGDNYGYRSSLNRSMVEHLRGVVRDLVERAPPRRGDLVIDIGSNDGTLLSFYPADGPDLVGVDPTARKFARFYPPHVRAIADFFSADLVRAQFGNRKARIVTSIAMLYDLDAPLDFARQVAEVLADDGVWHFEQSYLPSMLAANAYDTVCHEHLEYYALRQIRYITDRAGLKILDVAINDVNGGSFAVTVAKSVAPCEASAPAVGSLLRSEESQGLSTLAPYEAFRRRVFAHRERLLELLEGIQSRGQRTLGYGASTKGNVVLQFCGITARLVPCIAEVNEDKFGRFTPGTGIPIVSEAEARAMRPDYFLVLPWHFRKGILEREADFLRAGGKMIFPLPGIEIVGG